MLRPLGRGVPTVLGEQQQRSVRVLVGIHILCRSICMYFKILLSFQHGQRCYLHPWSVREWSFAPV